MGLLLARVVFLLTVLRSLDFYLSCISDEFEDFLLGETAIFLNRDPLRQKRLYLAEESADVGIMEIEQMSEKLMSYVGSVVDERA